MTTERIEGRIFDLLIGSCAIAACVAVVVWLWMWALA